MDIVIYGEVVNVDTLDSGAFILTLCTVSGESVQQIIPQSYYDKVCAKWLDEGSLVKVSQEERIIGKTTWKDKAGNEVVHGKDEKGKWKEGFEARNGEKSNSFAGINKISTRLFEKMELDVKKRSAKKVVGKSFEENENAALAQVLANIEMA